MAAGHLSQRTPQPRGAGQPRQGGKGALLRVGMSTLEFPAYGRNLNKRPELPCSGSVQRLVTPPTPLVRGYHAPDALEAQSAQNNRRLPYHSITTCPSTIRMTGGAGQVWMVRPTAVRVALTQPKVLTASA